VNARTREVAAPSTAQIAQRIEEVDAAIRAKAATRAALLDDLESTILRAPVGDVEVARKRRSLAELDSSVGDLRASLQTLKQHRREAQQRESDAKWADSHAKSRERAEDLKNAVAKLQEAIDAVVPIAMAVRDADVSFVESLRRPPSDFDAYLVSVSLPQLIALRLHVLSNGHIRAARVFENVYELQQSGAADLVKHATGYTVVGLRGHSIPPMLDDFEPDPPPLAA